jgi:hypothetical protein
MLEFIRVFGQLDVRIMMGINSTGKEVVLMDLQLTAMIIQPLCIQELLKSAEME